LCYTSRLMCSVAHAAPLVHHARCLHACDVTGDGTFRKYRDKWRHWQPHQGRQLHSLQVQIAVRGLALLKVGGLLSYSTCSLNPMEDESVVAELLRRTAGTVEVVDVSGRLDGLATWPGMPSWQVLTDKLEVLASYADVASLPGEEARRYRRSMWPPPPSSPISASLRRCQRLLPHANNTGGFFVCILKKTAAWPPPRCRQEDSLRAACGTTSAARSAQGGAARGVGWPRPPVASPRPVLHRLSAQDSEALMQGLVSG